MRLSTCVVGLVLAVPAAALAAESHGPVRSGSAIDSALVPPNLAVANDHDPGCATPRPDALAPGSGDVQSTADEARGAPWGDGHFCPLQGDSIYAKGLLDWSIRPVDGAAGSASINVAHHRSHIDSQPAGRAGGVNSAQVGADDSPVEGASALQAQNPVQDDPPSLPVTGQLLGVEPDEADLLEVTVQSRRPEEQVPQGAFRAIPWAFTHPSQAWRILTPVTD